MLRTHILALLLVGAVVAAGCSAGGDAAAIAEPAAAQPAAATEEPTEGRPVDFVGDLSVAPSKAVAGTEATVTGADLPADTDFDVIWTTVDCDWVIQGEMREEYHGRECTPKEVPLTTARSDASGDLTATFDVPDDYGFAHDVILVDGAGVIRNRTIFTVEMQVSITPESGPAGTPVTIEIKGMGYQSLEDTRTIIWDNRYVGFMSAVSTGGTARAVIPAIGEPGPHWIEMNRGAFTFPYLNPEQSPRPDIPTFSALFTITEGDPVLPPPIEEQNPQPVRRAPVVATSGASIATDLVSGPTGTPFTLRGTGFEAGADVTLLWYRIVGNRVSGGGWDEQDLELGTVTASADGTFEFATEIPGDVGGPHRIEAVVSGTKQAETSVSITPQADPLTAQRVREGDDVVLHLTGVGWTETANIYTIVYDNAYLGYACGFNTQGDVLVTLKATGGPGWHFVDLYPAIYKGQETRGRDNFRIPQLTYADDHPGEDLPGFRFAFYVEG